MANDFASIACPKCGNTTTQTTSSSTTAVRGEYRRTRRCPKCSGQFSTYEIYAAEAKFLRVARKAFMERTDDEPTP